MGFRNGLFITLVSVFIAKGQISTPKYSNEFLRIGVGARAGGMGNTATATSDDATAGYWNPAMLVHAPDYFQATLMHSERFAGIIKYDYGAVQVKLRNNAHFGGTFIRLGVDDIPNTLQFKDGGTFNYDKITSFSIADMALLLSYAWNLKHGIGGGVNAKIIHRRVGPFAVAWGFGFDIGAVKTWKERLRIGVIARDVTGTFNAWSFNTKTFEKTFLQTGNDIPENSVELTLPSLTTGMQYQFFPEKKFSLLMAFDMDVFFDKQRNTLIQTRQISLDPHIGGELSYKKKVFLRAGAYQFQRSFNTSSSGWLMTPTVGAGVLLNLVQIDYALTTVGSFNKDFYSHLVSISFNWKK
jgi:hypothetical protein